MTMGVRLDRALDEGVHKVGVLAIAAIALAASSLNIGDRGPRFDRWLASAEAGEVEEEPNTRQKTRTALVSTRTIPEPDYSRF